jgi:hypothetical protein
MCLVTDVVAVLNCYNVVQQMLQFDKQHPQLFCLIHHISSPLLTAFIAQVFMAPATIAASIHIVWGAIVLPVQVSLTTVGDLFASPAMLDRGRPTSSFKISRHFTPPEHSVCSISE